MKASLFIVVMIVVAGAFASRDLRSCGSCGKECMISCGTRVFKTCCFNYLKKRSELSSGLPFSLEKDWLAKSRSSLYQRFFQKDVIDGQDGQLSDSDESAKRILQHQ